MGKGVLIYLSSQPPINSSRAVINYSFKPRIVIWVVRDTGMLHPTIQGGTSKLWRMIELIVLPVTGLEGR